jgi:hypothetical protein
VVECGGLENRYIFTGIRGSNPWLSAKNGNLLLRQVAVFYFKGVLFN